MFDGLRPDQVTPELTPRLVSFARSGVRFLNHHATFPTHTRVNVASMFTGRYPGGHGVVGNTMFLPDIDPSWEISTANHEAIINLEQLLDGHFLMSESLGEILHRNGKTMTAMGVGTSGNAFLHHHKARTVGGAVIHPDFTIPESIGVELAESYGPWPAQGVPNDARIKRATEILLDYVIPKYAPDVATLWYSDPDSTQHSTAVGSGEALNAITLADAQFGRILDHLQSSDLADSTDVMVVSDHGHSSVSQNVNVRGMLVDEGIKQGLDSTDILVADNGGCVSIYVPGHDPVLVGRVIEFLASQSWAGPMFGRDGTNHPGVFPLSKILNANERSPDILMSFSWTAEVANTGVLGLAPSTGAGPLGRGNHGSISPFEIHNVLLASGPHFKAGIESNVPSGNVDIFPTMLNILGIAPIPATDGRVLSEALKGGPAPEEIFVESDIHVASDSALGYGQTMQISRVGETIYLDKARAVIGDR